MAGPGHAEAAGPRGSPFDPKASKRRLTSWIDGFYEYTESLPSPPIFKTWAALSIIAGALEQKVWATPAIGELYPHLYVVLVGPPGVGKSVLTAIAKRLWSELEGQFVSSDAVSRASFIDDLREADRRIIVPNLPEGILAFNSMKVGIDEMGVLLPEYERELVNAITHFYDVKPYAERKRTKDLKYKMLRPQLNILAACTPSYLKDTLPDGAWDQGFTSRFVFVYSGQTFRRELFEENIKLSKDKLFGDLLHDLQHIGRLTGRFSFDSDVVKALSKWHMSGGDPRPDHPKLQHYNTRRSVHLLKLCMAMAVGHSDELRVSMNDYQLAFDILTEVEGYMPDIFKAMATGGDGRLIEDTWHYAYNAWMKYKKPLQQSVLIGFLAERAPAHSIQRILDVMVGAKILTETMENKIGKCYTPRGRKPI